MMVQRLYKYKSASTYDIDNLLMDSLWVSSLDRMNDPLEFGFYVERDLDLSKIVPFQQWLLQHYCCMSFSTSIVCRRLWNYYTNAMKGMAVEYTDLSIRKALEKRGISSVDYNQMVPKRSPKFDNIASEGKVVYDGEKTDLSDWYRLYLTGNAPMQFVPSEAFFHKDESWADEKEYRFIFAREYLKDKNLLSELVPNSIYIGYQMPSQEVEKISVYCATKKIPLYMYTPDFHSEKSKKYSKNVIYQPEGNTEKQELVEIT